MHCEYHEGTPEKLPLKCDHTPQDFLKHRDYTRYMIKECGKNKALM